MTVSTQTNLPAKTTIDGITYWYDASGNQIREDNISDIDQIRDDFVNKSMTSFKAQVESLKAFKKSMWEALDEFLALSASEHKKEYKGTRGGFALHTFNGKYRIRVLICDYQQCDERMETARSMIKECLIRWSRAGSNLNLIAFVEQKYALKDNGEINVKDMLSLRRIKIKDDAEWKQAMDIMTDSLFTAESKSQLRFFERDDKTGKYHILKADFSAI